jgi:hypothetical protein
MDYYRGAKPSSERRVAAEFSADALYRAIRADFQRIPEHAQGEVEASLADALMTGFAVFSLKDASLLAFDQRRKTEHNLGAVYGIEKVLCDSQLRTRLDEVDPQFLRAPFHTLLGSLERSGLMEPFSFLNGYYLLALDGTGVFHSDCLQSAACLVKQDKKTGKKTYYQQMLQGAFIHPDLKEVLPLAPEMIIKQDGQAKNDCERNAAKRFLANFREACPRLKVIVTEDALSPNAPHLRDLKKHNARFILGVKSGDHKFLFDYIEAARREGLTQAFEIPDPRDPDVIHKFLYLNEVPINKSNLDLEVNFLEYWEVRPSGTKHFSWVTDIRITRKNAYHIMRGGRARWKIENETFNTLKNQGYHLEHNFGLGKQHLSAVFSTLMLLAFLTDQLQQLCWPMFKAAWDKYGSKKALWEAMRQIFKCFRLDSANTLYDALVHGVKFQAPDILYDTS